MGRQYLLLFALLAACTRGPDDDLQYIKQARSIAAEWALVNEQANAGRVNVTYVTAMHGWLRDGLLAASSSLSEPKSDYGAEISALLALPSDAAPATLRSHSESLKLIEDALESA